MTPELVNLLDAVLLIALALWAYLILRRVRRLARYFQLEGYESKRYLRWLGRRTDEMHYLLLSCVVLVISALAGTLNLAWTVYTGIAMALPVFAWITLPRDKQQKQQFVPTPRARRLLAVALILCALPALFSLFMLTTLIGVIQDVYRPVLTSALAGAGLLGWALSPMALPLANLILFPYEAMVRQKFMRLAKRRLQASGARVLCITGSYGKTSTKHYLQHILGARFRSAMTPKSYNTLMGISRAINEYFEPDETLDFYITEADAYFVGENASICRLVEPEIGLVMTVGPMHLERLGSMENIATAQYEVIESLPPTGAGIFNGDDPLVLGMYEREYPPLRLMVTQHGVPGARLEALNVQHRADGLHFTLCDRDTGDQVTVYAPLYGETNITNILMATAAALHLGMRLPEIAPRIATLQPADHRLVRRVLPDGTVIIDDAYSANPVGTKAALDVLKLHDQSTRRIVISSGMFELGAQADEANRRLGQYMADAATDVILIGAKQAAPIQAGLAEQGFPAERLHVVETLEAAIDVYRGVLAPGDTLLMLTDLPDTYAG